MFRVAIFWLLFVLVNITCAEESSMQSPIPLSQQAYDLQNLAPLDENAKQISAINAPQDNNKPVAKISKNLSIKTNAFESNGYSEFELETKNAIPNEVESALSRYGVGAELNYSLKPSQSVNIEFFVSNALELNFQRKGGKTKTYHSLIRYEDNVYDYGNKIIYPAWVNSIGMAINILKSHNIQIIFRQASIASNDINRILSNSAMFSNIFQMPIANTVGNIYAYSTQIFILYVYRF